MVYSERDFARGFKMKGPGQYQPELSIPPYSCPNRIRLLRSQKDWSIPKLAKAVGRSREAVYEWETGGSFPRKDAIQKLCEVFECKAGDLFWREGEQENG